MTCFREVQILLVRADAAYSKIVGIPESDLLSLRLLSTTPRLRRAGPSVHGRTVSSGG